MSDATPLDDRDLRLFALEELTRHTPALQENNGYERCALCHFTRHPCDVYDLAAAVLRLLERMSGGVLVPHPDVPERDYEQFPKPSGRITYSGEQPNRINKPEVW